MKVTKNALAIDDFLKGKGDELIDALVKKRVSLKVRGEDIKLYVNCNDVFYWVTSDFEPIDESELKDLNECYKLTPYGGMLWCCRKRKMRPQKHWYEIFNEEETKLFNACGEERDV